MARRGRAPQGKTRQARRLKIKTIGGFMTKKNQYLAELTQISAETGMVRPADVVRFAQNESTALHGVFEWDDSVAGHNFRLQQARQLLRVMVVTLPGDNALRYRAYVSLKEDRFNGQGYCAMIDVLSDATRRERMLLEALEELATFQQKYAALKELSGVFEEMTRVARPKVVRKTKGAPATKYKRQPQVAAG